MFSASTKSGKNPTGGAADPQFNNVTMLLHGDGTNGAQNNTFLDSSTNNFAITRNGNTTQGSFSPYGSNWSTFFDGTQDNLYTPSTSALNVGSGNFTFECFFNVSVFNGGNIIRGSNQYSACALLLVGTGVVYYISSTGSSWDIAEGKTAIGSGLSAGVWYHLALVRNGNVVTPYVNGVAGTTTTTSATFSALNGLNIGAEQNGVAGGSFNGYISNVRIVVGTAVYTSNFTPPTANLTAISGTQLLACQNNQFKDNSSNNFLFTTVGTPSVQRFNPFGTATAYSTSVIGGSGYFDGNGDYLQIGPNTALGFGTGDFTIEAWVYPKFTDGGAYVIADITLNIATFYVQSNTLRFYDGNGYNSGLTVTSQAWNHVAWVRSSGSLKMYVNGIGSSAFSATGNYGSNEQIRIGTEISSWWNGYISNLRVVKGTAVYAANFTPPTAPITAITNTSLLTNFTNGAIYDNGMINDLETAGTAQISTSVVKYGTGSMYFSGSNDWLSILNTSTSTISGVGSWTIEGWIYPTTVDGSYRAIYTSGYPIQIFLRNGSVEIYLSTNPSGSPYFINGTGGPASSVSVNVWTHFAVVNNANTYTVYINGVGGTSATNASSIAFPSNPNATIGDAPIFGTYPYIGYIDDFRITKGFARYTANFTPPTAAFPNTGPL